MNEYDEMMSSLGFDETSIKNYGNAIPFTSRKLNIMNQIHQASTGKAHNLEIFALFYIFSIAFLVMVMRFIVSVQVGNLNYFRVMAGMIIHYFQQIQSSLTIMSFLISMLICLGTGVMINHLKNKSDFC